MRVQLTACVMAAALGLGSAGAEGEPGRSLLVHTPRTLLVHTPRTTGQYAQVIEALKEALPAGLEVALRVQDAQGSDRCLEPAAVHVTLGSRATATCVTAPGRKAPVVAALVPDATGLTPQARATGVQLGFPASAELAWLSRVMGTPLRVGVLYRGATAAERVEEGRRAALALGLRLVARRVDRRTDLLSTAESLAGAINVLWVVPDAELLTAASIRPLLLFFFRQRLPVMGLAETWVRAGALLALERDFEDMGRQVGALAGAAMVDDLRPVEPPRRSLLILNLRTAEHMRVNVPMGVQHEAVRTIR
jgi:putative tryptophan/tyrosine transport system substrate-binding protein